MMFFNMEWSEFTPTGRPSYQMLSSKLHFFLGYWKNTIRSSGLICAISRACRCRSHRLYIRANFHSAGNFGNSTRMVSGTLIMRHRRVVVASLIHFTSEKSGLLKATICDDFSRSESSFSIDGLSFSPSFLRRLKLTTVAFSVLFEV